MRRRRKSDRRGFSMLELVIVVAIMLVIAAYALPNIVSTISDYRLKNAMTQVASLYQQQRMRAVQSNSVMTVPDATMLTGETVLYIDANNNGSYDVGEPMVQLPQKIGVVKSGAPTLDTTALSGSFAFTSQPQNTYVVRFNARGLPCLGTAPCLNLDALINPPPRIGFLIYFRNNRSFGETGWGAITITPAGRINTWFYNGSTYSMM